MTCPSSKYSVWESGASRSPAGRMRANLTPRHPDRPPAGRGGSRTTAFGTVTERSFTHPASTSGTKFGGGGGGESSTSPPSTSSTKWGGGGIGIRGFGFGGGGSAVWLLVNLSVCLSLTIPGTYFVLTRLNHGSLGLVTWSYWPTVLYIWCRQREIFDRYQSNNKILSSHLKVFYNRYVAMNLGQLKLKYLLTDSNI